VNNYDKKFIEELKKIHPARVQEYLSVFDRLLLHVVALQVLNDKQISSVISLWKKAVKQSIDFEATERTNFLESRTHASETAKYRNEPDGEDLRLSYNQSLDFANEILLNSLTPPPK